MKRIKKLGLPDIIVLTVLISQVTLFILKVKSIITWSWLVVCLPVAVPIVLLMIATMIVYMVYAEDLKDE